MDLGGHRGDTDPDIITELIKYIEILFSNSHKRNRLVGKLHQYHEKVSKLLKDDKGADRTPEGDDFELYKKYATKTRELLADYLPEMLKGEQWFSDVFYSA